MVLGLHNLRAPSRAVHRPKRVGRGPGSGHGKTATRGHKGQKSRSGFSLRPGFEGGQMPLIRRLPKRGFTNAFKKQWAEVNVDVLEAAFEAGAEVTPEILHERGIVKKIGEGIVILGRGELTKPLRVVAHRFSASAREKILTAGGSVQVIAQ